jgi:hypothetical protein
LPTLERAAVFFIVAVLWKKETGRPQAVHLVQEGG